MEDAAFRTIKDKYDKIWVQIWTFYQNLKKEKNLTSHDILRQLNGSCTFTNLAYLSINGDQRRPSYKQGTVGRKIWDILLPGLRKTNWLSPTILTYEEKFREVQSNGYFHQYDIYIVSEVPLIINLDINHEKHYDGIDPQHNKDELARILTIDEIVPEIKQIGNSYWF